MRTDFFVVAMVAVISILFLMYLSYSGLFAKLKEKTKRRLRKKRLLKNAVFIIGDAVWNYAYKNNPALIAKWGGGSGTLANKMFRMRMHVETDVLPEISKWQDLFDEILRLSANTLHKVYCAEDRWRREGEATDSNSLSREEIDAMLHKKEELANSKREAEKMFWDLHNTLQCLGLKTWDSYKTYLKLKPTKAFTTVIN